MIDNMKGNKKIEHAIKQGEHPGVIFAKFYFDEAEGLLITADKLLWNHQFLTLFMRGEVPVTDWMSEDLAREFDTTERFWMNMQEIHDKKETTK